MQDDGGLGVAIALGSSGCYNKMILASLPLTTVTDSTMKYQFRLLLTKSTVGNDVATASFDTETQYFSPWSSTPAQSITYVEEIKLTPSHSVDTVLLSSWARDINS